MLFPKPRFTVVLNINTTVSVPFYKNYKHVYSIDDITDDKASCRILNFVCCDSNIGQTLI